MPLEGKDLAGHHVYTRNIAAAASLLAIGAKLRPQMPVTVSTRGAGEDVIFWFEPGEVEVAGIKRSVEAWLGLLLCPWSGFDLSLDHPVAFLKAGAENRQILVAGVKQAEKQPFKVIQRGNRIAVLGPAMSEANARRLLNEG